MSVLGANVRNFQAILTDGVYAVFGPVKKVELTDEHSRAREIAPDLKFVIFDQPFFARVCEHDGIGIPIFDVDILFRELVAFVNGVAHWSISLWVCLGNMNIARVDGLVKVEK
jgi:hypothetical protein